ncbi:hypothetical protein PoMZ_09812 [Pyricularia oryzae]|uniref:Uncharacterized protein n=1 Tax=Pyricularia oryzae TaxID=318829 RepID=A0A4P7MY91_PYROR|nr:hypothetical protein PoMZ_09812 [Pyricularia oryzae]
MCRTPYSSPSLPILPSVHNLQHRIRLVADRLAHSIKRIIPPPLVLLDVHLSILTLDNVHHVLVLVFRILETTTIQKHLEHPLAVPADQRRALHVRRDRLGRRRVAVARHPRPAARQVPKHQLGHLVAGGALVDQLELSAPSFSVPSSSYWWFSQTASSNCMSENTNTRLTISSGLTSFLTAVGRTSFSNTATKSVLMPQSARRMSLIFSQSDALRSTVWMAGSVLNVIKDPPNGGLHTSATSSDRPIAESMGQVWSLNIGEDMLPLTSQTAMLLSSVPLSRIRCTSVFHWPSATFLCISAILSSTMLFLLLPRDMLDLYPPSALLTSTLGDRTAPEMLADPSATLVMYSSKRFPSLLTNIGV